MEAKIPAAPPVGGGGAPGAVAASAPVGSMEPELSNIHPIPIKKTLLIVNHFVINTTHFLNQFARLCEQKLAKVGKDMQRLEIVLAILEAKLNSIDWLEAAPSAPPPASSTVPTAPSIPAAPSVGAGIPSAPPMDAAAVPVAPAVPAGPPPPPENFTPVSQDPTYAKYFKMLKMGVPKEQLRLKLRADGYDEGIIDMDPMAPSPGGGAPPESSQALVEVDEESGSDDD